MKMTIATPLFPPDIAPSAGYIKELSRRLASHYTVTVVTYGHLPEHVDNVRIECVDKRQPAILRIPFYTFRLWQITRKGDVLFAQNGASVELPILIVSLITRMPFLIHMGDTSSRERARNNLLFHYIENLVMKRAHKILTQYPVSRPEILPFDKNPEEKLQQYEGEWQQHLKELNEYFDHV